MGKQQFIERHPKYVCIQAKKRLSFDELVAYCKANHDSCGIKRCSTSKMLMDKGVI